MKFINKKKAFTLLEILLTVSIFAVASAVLSPIYFSSKNKDELSTKADMLVSSLRRAQILSMSGQEDSSWGVKISNSNFVIFKGSDYVSRDANFDDVISVNKNISNEGLDEVVFSKIFGETTNVGEIKLKTNTQEIIIDINKKGIVNY